MQPAAQRTQNAGGPRLLQFGGNLLTHRVNCRQVGIGKREYRAEMIDGARRLVGKRRASIHCTGSGSACPFHVFDARQPRRRCLGHRVAQFRVRHIRKTRQHGVVHIERLGKTSQHLENKVRVEPGAGHVAFDVDGLVVGEQIDETAIRRQRRVQVQAVAQLLAQPPQRVRDAAADGVARIRAEQPHQRIDRRRELLLGRFKRWLYDGIPRHLGAAIMRAGAIGFGGQRLAENIGGQIYRVRHRLPHTGVLRRFVASLDERNSRPQIRQDLRAAPERLHHIAAIGNRLADDPSHVGRRVMRELASDQVKRLQRAVRVVKLTLRPRLEPQDFPDRDAMNVAVSRQHAVGPSENPFRLMLIPRIQAVNHHVEQSFDDLPVVDADIPRPHVVGQRVSLGQQTDAGINIGISVGISISRVGSRSSSLFAQNESLCVRCPNDVPRLG